MKLHFLKRKATQVLMAEFLPYSRQEPWWEPIILLFSGIESATENNCGCLQYQMLQMKHKRRAKSGDGVSGDFPKDPQLPRDRATWSWVDLGDRCV